MTVDLIADTLAWHRTLEVPVRRRWRTVGYRYDCPCGWQSAIYRRRDRRTWAVERGAARTHVAQQIAEALEWAEREGAGPWKRRRVKLTEVVTRASSRLRTAPQTGGA